jgi:hypothetical protein
LEFKLDYNTFIQNGITFFAQECLDNNIKVEWLKQGWDLIEYHSNKNLYDY